MKLTTVNAATASLNGAPRRATARGKGDAPNVPNANKALKLQALSFDQPDRALSCLEVDFPIGPINTLAQLEINAKKPIYEMGKWWARRQSSVFRSLLIAAALQAPAERNEADKLVWDSYYANHQRAGNFKELKVLDPFMGGGTTLVEAARLGFDVYGVDLNPVAWFVTKTELSSADPERVQALFAVVEREVRPHVAPYTVTGCPRGHRGRWYRVDDAGCPFDVNAAINAGFSVAPMEDGFDILAVSEAERPRYRYHGPEIIYTFWSKHGPCARCGQRTPVLRSPVVAIKDLQVKATSVTCPGCRRSFDWEFDQARMAPAEPLAVAPDEPPFVAPGRAAASAACPHCAAAVNRPSEQGARRKTVALTLLVHPRWFAGSPGSDAEGERGGWAGAPAPAERRWMTARAETLSLVEVRGKLPRLIADLLSPGTTIDTAQGTAVLKAPTGASNEMPDYRDSSFTCGQCGFGHDFLTEVKKTGHTAPAYPYTLQCFCPECKAEGRPYGGRFFKTPDSEDRDRWLAAVEAWQAPEAAPLRELVPQEKLPFAHMTHDLNGGIPNWGYTHWWKMFNPRQLLTHARLLDALMRAPDDFDQATQEAALNAFQQYLRNQNMFCFWDHGYDKLVPFMSNNNYHPKATIVENSVYPMLGRGNFVSCIEAVIDGLRWARQPWEKSKAVSDAGTGSIDVPIDDSIPPRSDKNLVCGSSTDLSRFADGSFDLVVSDPPFGDNVFYADLADFFYVWLRRPLSRWYPQIFAAPETNKVQEAITNPAEHPDERPPDEKRREKREGVESPAEQFYRETLTECWREAARVLKPGGTLAFTFHHSKDEAWVGVLRSLFDAGLALIATYPIRSDESKGESGAFGSKKIEYDIIHVCRKRLEEPQPVSWPRMRAWVQDELGRLHGLLQHYQERDVSDADIRVILRGKALEFYSRHYGQIFTGMDEPLDIGPALVGINDILEERTLPAADRPPASADPLTAHYLRIFRETPELPRDDFSKLLRGTGVAPREFHERGWTADESRMVRIVPIQSRFARFRERPRHEMKYDLDQAHFLVGAAIPGSGVNIREELARATWALKPSVPDILRWLAEHEEDTVLQQAARLAGELVAAARLNGAERSPSARPSLFDVS